MKKPIGILYEHPLWFEPLFAELSRRGISFEKILAQGITSTRQSAPFPTA